MKYPTTLLCLAPSVLAIGCTADAAYFDEQRTYWSQPENCTGSPENPYCAESIEFAPDGTLHRTFDDVIVEGEYEIRGDVVRVRTTSPAVIEELTLSDDENTLTGEDAVWRRDYGFCGVADGETGCVPPP